MASKKKQEEARQDAPQDEQKNVAGKKSAKTDSGKEAAVENDTGERKTTRKEKGEKTPTLSEQYKSLKEKHPDAMLLFRSGDFYHTLNEDAKKASDILGITLTKPRAKSQGEYMASFPYHALDTYLPKLIRAGQRVAIADMPANTQEKKQVAEVREVISKAEKKAEETTAKTEVKTEAKAGKKADTPKEGEVQEAKAERKRQNEYLMRVRSDAVVPSKLAADIESRLRANVEERAKKADAANAWGVFPSVLSQGVPAAVERRILDRLVSRIDEVRMDVTTEEVAKTVADDPAAHAKASESEKLFVVAYSAKALSEAMELALSEVSGADREELRGFLSARLQSGAVTKALERLVRKEVMPKWRDARAEAARKLAETTWPTLCDRTWYPPAELADETAARSDYSQAVRDWREVKGMESLAAADGGRPVMEEAAAKADERVAAAFDLARSAIAAQNEIVESSHAGVLAESRARKDSFWRRTPDLKAIAAMLTAATEDKWAERRIATLWPDGELPANADEQHAGLFPSVRRKIELMARMILEEMNEPVEQKPEEPPPQEETQDDSTSEEQPPEVPTFTISVSKNGDKVEAKLLKGKTPVVDKSVDAKLHPFESAMREISTTLGRDLLNLR